MILISNILSFFLESIVSFMFFENTLKPKIEQKYLRISAYILSFLVQLTLSFLSFPQLNLLSFIVCNFCLCLFMYKATAVQSVLNCIILSATLILTELSVYYLSGILIGFELNTKSNYTYIVFAQTLIIKLLYFVFVYLISKLTTKGRRLTVKFTNTAFLLVLPLASVLVLFGIVKTTELYTTNSYVYLTLSVGAILMLFSNVIVFGVYDNIIKTHEENTSLQLQMQKSELDLNYYSVLQAQYENSNILIHDIKRHLLSIKELSNEKDCEAINKYIDNLYGNYDINYIKKYSDNKLINAIINRYTTSFSKNSIAFYCDIRDIDFSFITDNDITALLDNLLENAFEASINSEGRFVDLSINKTNQNFVIITVSNSCKVPPNIKNGVLYSTKSNSILHGLGVKSIERIAKQYCGSTNCAYDKESMTFTFTVVLKTVGDIKH